MVPSVTVSRTFTTMFNCWYGVLFMKCWISVTPDLAGLKSSKKVNFCLISPHNIFPKVLEIIKIFLVSNGFHLGSDLLLE